MAFAMLFVVSKSAKWIAIWQRLFPLWVSLLLWSSGGSATAWQHPDGTFCATCTVPAPVPAPVVDECCKANPQQRAAMGLSAPDDCRQCCAPTPQTSPEKRLASSLRVAVLPVRFAFEAPIRPETCLFHASTQSSLDTLPRPPPRGRAPPVSLSISPFCRFEI